MSHWNISERLKIEHFLGEGNNFQEIADLLSKARSTIVREGKKHRVESPKVVHHRIRNRCIHRRECRVKHVCVKERCYRQCSTCSLCNEFCAKFQEEECQKVLAPPYVCNGYSEENCCTLKKQFYIHDSAEKAYRKLFTESRSVVNITDEERLFFDERIHIGTQRGAISTPHSYGGQSLNYCWRKDSTPLHPCRVTSYKAWRHASFLYDETTQKKSR